MQERFIWHLISVEDIKDAGSICLALELPIEDGKGIFEEARRRIERLVWKIGAGLHNLREMLRKNAKQKAQASGGTFVIVASRYNAEYVDAMVHAAREELLRAGAKIRVVRVPGAFEIPVVAARLAAKPRCAAVICLGVIFQGETSHAQQISDGVTHALAQIQVAHKIPIIHGVFHFTKVKQAKVRCLNPKHNRGTEAAHTALEMARVMAGL